jgi:hypothetical protein
MAEESFDIRQNYWTVHPQHDIDPTFKLFIEENNSDLEGTSTLMWFLKYCFHPKSIFLNKPFGKRVKDIGKSILGVEDFYEDNKEWLVVLADAYKELVETVLDRSIRAMQDTIDEKINFLASDDVSYNLTSYEDIDKMTVNLEKQNEVLDKLKDRRGKELSGTAGKGGQELSESDQGLI